MQTKVPILYMAPVRGITDGIYRKHFSSTFGGFDRAVTPFFRTTKDGLKTNALRDLIPLNDSSFPAIPQILTKNPIAFINASKALKSIGYNEINWNLGCPHPSVTQKGMGAGMLDHIDGVARFLDTVFAENPISISVKTRLGVEHSDRFKDLVAVFNTFPLKRVIVHPRTASQGYEGIVDLDAFEFGVHNVNHPLVYNGDIDSVHKFKQLAYRFPTINHWMIGRGAFRDPFLPSRIKHVQDLNKENERDILRTFHSRLYGDYCELLHGASHVLFKMREHWEYLIHSLNIGVYQPIAFLKQLKKTKTLSDYETLINRLFEI